jgi:capsular exopolysaccharide synthesis family protein
MSRIDEAMRRAAGAGAVEPPPEQTVDDLQPEETTSEATALAREPFPVEASERRPRPPVPQPAQPHRPHGSYDTTTPGEPAAPESTLFERLDARLTEKIVVDHNMSPASREQYRRLAAVLHDAHNTTGLRLIMVASAVAGEGKTLTASNLALTFSESYQKRVLLIDADLRRPALHGLVGARRVPGLSEVLIGMEPAAKAIQRVQGSRLALLPAGTPLQRNPADLLATHALRRLLAELRDGYDRIVVDTPPVGTIADALILAPQAEGVLVVARSGKVTRSALTHVLERLGNAGGKVLGVVLNRARPDRHAYDYGPGYARDAFVVSGRRALGPGSTDHDHESSGRLH